MDSLTLDEKQSLVEKIKEYTSIRKDYKKLDLEKKELQAKINTMKNNLKDVEDEIKEMLSEKHIDVVNLNNFQYELVEHSSLKAVTKSNILDKLTELVGEDKVKEAKALVEQNREPRTESILRVKELKRG